MRRVFAPTLGALILLTACGRTAFLGGSAGSTTPTDTPTPTATATAPTSQYGHRIPVTVNASEAGVPPGYALAVTFDHAALVSSSLSFADGHDLIVVGPAGGELDRVLDSGSSWDDPATTIWFRSPVTIPANTSATFYLYFDDPSASAPPGDPANVFLFADDFENGDLSGWTQKPAGYFSIDSAHAHRGSFALLAPPVGGSRRWIAASGASATDVSVDAWWYVEDRGDNIAQTAHAVIDTDDFETNYRTVSHLFSSTTGFDIANFQGGNFNEIDGLRGSVNQNAWTRVTVQIVGTKMRVLVKGQQVEPSSGWKDVGSKPPSGSFGVRAYDVKGNGWWIDDFTVRPLVDPEPTVSAGDVEVTP